MLLGSSHALWKFCWWNFQKKNLPVVVTVERKVDLPTDGNPTSATAILYKCFLFIIFNLEHLHFSSHRNPRPLNCLPSGLALAIPIFGWRWKWSKFYLPDGILLVSLSTHPNGTLNNYNYSSKENKTCCFILLSPINFALNFLNFLDNSHILR